MFQSTHPHGVRRPWTYVDILPLSVSIHAPTRGATSAIEEEPGLMPVSIHAPTRGATPERDSSSVSLLFQSTHPHGVRRRLCGSLRTVSLRFNPRTHTGCDFERFEQKLLKPRFQSTHPHGVRLSGKWNVSEIIVRFNPRTHTGCDDQVFVVAEGSLCFNPRTHTGCDHAPTLVG